MAELFALGCCSQMAEIFGTSVRKKARNNAAKRYNQYAMMIVDYHHGYGSTMLDIFFGCFQVPQSRNPDQQQTPNGILEGPWNAGSKKASEDIGVRA